MSALERPWLKSSVQELVPLKKVGLPDVRALHHVGRAGSSAPTGARSHPGPAICAAAVSGWGPRAINAMAATARIAMVAQRTLVRALAWRAAVPLSCRMGVRLLSYKLRCADSTSSWVPRQAAAGQDRHTLAGVPLVQISSPAPIPVSIPRTRGTLNEGMRRLSTRWSRSARRRLALAHAVTRRQACRLRLNRPDGEGERPAL